MVKAELWFLSAALGAIPILFYLNVLRRRYTGGKPLPPGPTPLPFIGNLLNLALADGAFHQKLAGLARIHGPVMMLKLGVTTTVVVSSRDAANEAFTKHDRSLAARAIPDSFRVRGYSERAIGFIPSFDPQWKALRGILGTHIFTPRGIASVRPIRERKVRDIINYFRAHAGKEVVIRQAIHTGVLNLVSSSFFSIDVADIGSKSAHELGELVDAIIAAISKPNVSDFYPILRPFDLQGLRRYTGRLFDRVFSILDDIIERRLAHSQANIVDKHGDFLDILLELMAADKIDRDHVMAMLFEAFVAGGDSIAFTVEWTMCELLRNPSVMAKVCVELKKVLSGKENIEEPDAAMLPYLQAVLKEAMRLHPVGPILMPHYAMEDGVVIGGYAVPKGSTVIFNAAAIMRDPIVWDRPDEFLPERFLETVNPLDFRGKDVEFIPFGSGRRLCPGVPLAERVLPFILASMLHLFHWQLPDGMSVEELDMSEKFMTVNVLAVPLKAVPVMVNI